MLSREAESFYWLGRYLERAEATARWYDIEYHARLESESAVSSALPWHRLLPSGAEEAESHTSDATEADGPLPDEAAILGFLILDRENPNSIRACVTAARENARGIREQISSEMWEHLNRFYLEMIEQTPESLLARTPYGLLRWVRSSCWLFDGIAERTMIRGEAWSFLQCGKFLERAESTARLLDAKYLAGADPDVGPPGLADLYRWTALLKSIGAYEAFRKVHGALSPGAIAAYVLLDARFPSAVCYALTRVEEALRRVAPPDEADGPLPCAGTNEALRVAGRLLASLVHSRSPELLGTLHETLAGVVDDCADLHHAVSRTFFSHLSWRPWEAEDAEDPRAAPAEWQAMASAQ
jgi:uncharacterized alpha-E superfamily protein